MLAEKLPIAYLRGVSVTDAIFALIFTGASLARRWTVIPPELKLFFFVVLFCEISNAVICGPCRDLMTAIRHG